jgi:hypothetical protein
MCHGLNILEQQYKINCIYDEGKVAKNFENDGCQYSFMLTSATQKLKLSKNINLQLIV